MKKSSMHASTSVDECLTTCMREMSKEGKRGGLGHYGRKDTSMLISGLRLRGVFVQFATGKGVLSSHSETLHISLQLSHTTQLTQQRGSAGRYEGTTGSLSSLFEAVRS